MNQFSRQVNVAVFSAAFQALMFLCLTGNAGAQEGTPLEPGKPIIRTAKASQIDTYSLTLTAGQFIRVMVEQNELNVAINLVASDNKILHRANAINTFGTESLSWEVTASGAYKVVVRTLTASRSEVPYKLQLELKDTATVQDQRRSAAEQLLTESLLTGTNALSWERKLEKRQQALQIWRELNDKEWEAVTLDHIGAAYFEGKQYDQGAETHRQSIALKQTSSNQAGKIATLLQLAAFFGQQEDDPQNSPEAARRLAQQMHDALTQALDLSRAIRHQGGERLTLQRLIHFYEFDGLYDKMIECQEQILRMDREHNWRAEESVSLVNLGIFHSKVGRYDTAMEYYQKSLAIALEARVRRIEAVNYREIANVYGWRGLYERAVEYEEKALIIWREMKNEREEAADLNNMGVQYLNLTHYEKAIELLEQSLALARKVKYRPLEGDALSNLGLCFFLLGRYDKAMEYQEKALPVYRETHYRIGEGAILGEIGSTLFKQGQPQKALTWFEQSLKILHEAQIRHAESLVLTNYAEVLRALGQIEQATSRDLEALQIAREIKALDNEAIALDGLLLDWQARRQQNLTVSKSKDNTYAELAEARTFVERALSLQETLRNQIVSRELRTSIQTRLVDRYKLYIDVLMDLERQSPGTGFAAQAFQASERARARNLLELLVESQTDIRAGVDPKLLTTERELQQRRNAKAEIQTTLLSGKHTPEQAAAIAKEITDITAQLSDVETQIRTASPRYAALTQPVPLTAAEIQQRVLDDETLLLEYSLGQKRSHLWVVTTKEIHSFVLPAANEIEAAARRWLDLLPKSTQRKYQRETELAATELSHLILAPAAAHLNKKRLVIVADGLLQYVPFTALPTSEFRGSSSASREVAQTAKPETRNSKLLIANYELVSLPSASALAVLRNEIKGRAAAAKQLAVFSDPVFQASDPRVQLVKTIRTMPGAANAAAGSSPGLAMLSLTRAAADAGITKFERLPFARQEAEAITALIASAQPLKALDFKASRATALNSELDQFRIIHFATHGLLNSQHPDLSGVVLSLVDEQGKAQDGFLRLNDLYNLRLNADLVVLSACQTALGKDVRGEGLIGLTRGFMYAGAARVVASLWNVNDAATAELMQKFYRAMMVEKQTPAAALRSAQLAMSRDARWSAPYYWSGFVLQGEWK